MSTPNIVFIHVESMDGRAMGCMDNAALRAATPNLDRLAENGVLFSNAYSTCPVCNPSRASMWSGRYPHAYDCWNNHEGLRPTVPTFRDALSAAGYITNAVGPLDYTYGLHSIRDRVGAWTRAAGVERPICRTPLPSAHDGEVHGQDRTLASRVLRWIDEVRDDARPFMLYFTTGLVHPPYTVERRFMQSVDASRIEIPPTLGEIDGVSHPADRYTRITKNCDKRFSERLVAQIRHHYFAMIAALDEIVGRVVNQLDDQGLLESTYLIFSSDHGEMAGEHNQILKRTMYEPSIHVPLIITGPDVRRGTRCEDPVSLIDIYPTLMDMAQTEGSQADHRPAGESLMPQLTGTVARRRPWVFAEYNGDRAVTGTYMIRKGAHKLIHHEGLPSQLFDVERDCWEERDLLAPALRGADSKSAEAEGRAVAAELESILQGGIPRGEPAGETPARIDSRAKAYDRESFLEWRAQALSDGTYEQTMAHVYSGFDRQCIEDLIPWRAEEEEKIAAWLDSPAT